MLLLHGAEVKLHSMYDRATVLEKPNIPSLWRPGTSDGDVMKSYRFRCGFENFIHRYSKFVLSPTTWLAIKD